MVDYISRVPAEEGAPEQAEAPALLLVHGFGAFGEQWRGQLAPLAAAGYQVWFFISKLTQEAGGHSRILLVRGSYRRC